MIKISIFLLAVFSLSLLTSCETNSGAESETAIKETVPAAQLLAQADELLKQREDLAKLREGIALLRRVRNADSKNFEANWKLSKFNYLLGKYTTDEKESEKAFKDGIDTGKTSINLDKNKPDGYFWTAANLGGRAKKSPMTYGITSVGEIRENMNKVIEIDPKYQGANAYDALAQIELETKLAGGKAEKALEYLETALKIEKENTFIYLHLAETHLALDNKPEAKKNLEYLLKMKPNPEYLPEYNECKEKAEKLLKNRF